LFSFVWKSRYSVGVRDLDRQHQTIMQGLNELHEELMNGKINEAVVPLVNNLVSIAAEHVSGVCGTPRQSPGTFEEGKRIHSPPGNGRRGRVLPVYVLPARMDDHTYGEGRPEIRSVAGGTRSALGWQSNWGKWMNDILMTISQFAPPLRGSPAVFGPFPHAEARG